MSASTRSPRAREALARGALSERDRAELGRALGAMGDHTHFAVRSSAVGEDSASDSFAGQMDTFLWVPRGDIERRLLD